MTTPTPNDAMLAMTTHCTVDRRLLTVANAGTTELMDTHSEAPAG